MEIVIITTNYNETTEIENIKVKTTLNMRDTMMPMYINT